VDLREEEVDGGVGDEDEDETGDGEPGRRHWGGAAVGSHEDPEVEGEGPARTPDLRVEEPLGVLLVPDAVRPEETHRQSGRHRDDADADGGARGPLEVAQGGEPRNGAVQDVPLAPQPSPEDEVEEREGARHGEGRIAQHVQRDVEREDRATKLRANLSASRDDEGEEKEEERDRHEERPEGPVVVTGLEDEAHGRQEEAEEGHRAEEIAVGNRLQRDGTDVEEPEIEGGPEAGEDRRQPSRRDERVTEPHDVENRRARVAEEGDETEEGVGEACAEHPNR